MLSCWLVVLWNKRHPAYRTRYLLSSRTIITDMPLSISLSYSQISISRSSILMYLRSCFFEKCWCLLKVNLEQQSSSIWIRKVQKAWTTSSVAHLGSLGGTHKGHPADRGSSKGGRMCWLSSVKGPILRTKGGGGSKNDKKADALLCNLVPVANVEQCFSNTHFTSVYPTAIGLHRNP